MNIKIKICEWRVIIVFKNVKRDESNKMSFKFKKTKT